MAKRILIFSTSYYPKHVGGAEVAIKEITDRIQSDTYTFDMVTMQIDSSLPRSERIGNVIVHRVGFGKREATLADAGTWPLKLNKLMFPILGAWKAHRLHRQNHYNAIWGMMATIAGFAAMFFKMTHKDVPYLLTLQEGDPIPELKHKARFVYPLYERIFTSADHIQAISHYLAEFATNMGFTGEVAVVPNGVNTKHFSTTYTDDELEDVRKKVGASADKKLIITTSRLAKKNAVDDCIMALKDMDESTHLLVFGTGEDEEKLKVLTRKLSLEKRVHFHGYVDHKDLPKYLKVADVFVRPSRSEGFGNSFVEAMAAGIPVVATQEGGIADFLFDPDRNPDKDPTGLAVDVDSPKQIALQLTRALDDSALRDTIVRNALKMVREKYDWDIVASDMQSKAFDIVCAR